MDCQDPAQMLVQLDVKEVMMTFVICHPHHEILPEQVGDVIDELSNQCNNRWTVEILPAIAIDNQHGLGQSFCHDHDNCFGCFVFFSN